MDRKELVKIITKATPLKQAEASRALDAVFDSIAVAVTTGQEIRIVGFGDFAVRRVAASLYEVGLEHVTGKKFYAPGGAPKSGAMDSLAHRVAAGDAAHQALAGSPERIVDLKQFAGTFISIATEQGPMDPEEHLAVALAAARQRGRIVKDGLIEDPGMLSTAEIAERLGMSAEGIRGKRRRHELLGLEFAKRGIRYPSWQLVAERQVLPGLVRLFEVLGADPWRIYRFLEQRHAELGGKRGRDALAEGDVERAVATAENVATGAFA